MSEPVPTSFEMDEPEREAAPLSDRSQTTDVEKEDTESVEQRKPFNPAEIRMDVKTVNLDVLPGETLGLVGESGCGKSTTGRALMQLPRPTSGQVLFQGNDLTKLKDLSKLVETYSGVPVAKNKAVVSAGKARVAWAGSNNYGWPSPSKYQGKPRVRGGWPVGIVGSSFMQRADEAMRPRAIAELEQAIDKKIREKGLG